MRVAAVIPGGGMVNAFVSGVIKGAQLQPSHFNAIFTHSSAAHLSAFFIAGQIELSKRIWVDELTKSEVFNRANVLKGKRPANVDFLVDECCKELDIDAVTGSRTKLVVSLFRRRDGKTKYFEATKQNIRTLLKATGAIPLIARPVTLADASYADGGTGEALPVEKAYAMGYRKILVILNEPIDVEMESFSKLITWLAFPTSGNARRAAQARKSHFDKAIDFIQRPPADVEVHVISPGKKLPAARFCRSKKLVEETYQIGVEKGQTERDILQGFLKSETPLLSATMNLILKLKVEREGFAG